MLYKGALKFGNLDIDCNPCVVRGEYFYQNDLLVVSKGIVILKSVDDVIVITNQRVIRIPIVALQTILTNKNMLSVIGI
ncbi:VP7 [Sulfolobus filamentous virus 1]|uniref:VP7 n=2 Tax=Alphalipothrixvirus beppuense TaxID=2734584 RepID=A0A346LU72_SUFV1|nr:VP7 [Sulfolobus filamentous virus 1]AXQ00115.1 VP7 [Sulfolobus filamentous virus 1]AZI75735.1 putative viral structural protein [Sulfolobales Beppu filamentous phage 1]